MNKPLLTVLLTVIVVRSIAQGYRDPAIWNNIETAIRTKTNLATTLGRVQALKQEATTANDCIHLARALYCEMLIKDQRSEDTLYFKNSAFIDSMLYAPSADACLKTMLHLLQAKRLTLFNNRRLRFNRARYERNNLRYNYAAYPEKELDSLAALHYEAALTGMNILPDQIDQVRWVYSGPFLFLFRPDLKDLIFAEYISHTGYANRYNDHSKYIRKWLALPQDKFLHVVDSLSAASGRTAPFFQLYNAWLKKNRDDKTALYFIEKQLRDHLYERNDEDSLTQKVYERYLQTNLTAAPSSIKAHAVYSFCLWLAEGSNKFHSYKGYDSSYQSYAARALQLYEQQKALLDSFPYFTESLVRMKEKLLAKKLHVEMSDNHLPGEPVKIRAGYKNNDVLYYRIIPITAGEKLPQNERKAAWHLLNRTPLVRDTFQLQGSEDHNEHTIDLKLRAFPAGNYCLLFSDREFTLQDTTLNYISFGVTGIAVINNDERVFVLDRKTGFPLEGASVSCFYPERIKSTKRWHPVRINKTLLVNKEGFVTITNKRVDSLQIIYKGDTTQYDLSLDDDDRDTPDDAYDKEEYDGLLDYYDMESVLHIYTDRSIYRPGQTVFYKVVFMTRDPRTGKFMLFNKRNLRGGLLNGYFNKWFRENEPLLYLEDAFRRNVDSVKMKVNEYGSFSGSFVIPKTAATGTWYIEPDYVDTDYRNEGSFQVEEYKRPTFEATLQKPEGLLLPGDPFTLTVKTKSFSGALLNNIPVHYTLSRAGSLPVYDSLEEKETTQYKTEVLSDTVGSTNDKGELSIRVSDSLVSRYGLSDEKAWSFRYELRATIVDASGETATLNDAVGISSRPVQISFGIQSMVDRQKLSVANVTTTIGDTSAPAGKKVEVSIYKLYDDRKKELLLETLVNTAAFEKLTLPVEQMPAGKYELKGICREEGKILGEVIQQLTVFDTQAGSLPEQTNDFSYLAANSVMAGDTITYYHGSSNNAVYAIYELQGYVQKGKRAALQHTYTLRPLPQGLNTFKIVIPKEATGNMLFTHVFILNNQVHKHHETIYVTNRNTTRPELIIEKYRSSLMPGAKETFAVSVKTKNEKIAAELMTTMYDATLDKLEEHSWSLPESDDDNNPSFRKEWPVSLGQWEKAAIRYPELYTPSMSSPLIALQGRVSGLTIVSASGLNEVVVSAGYYSTTSRVSTGNIVKIRGQNSIRDFSQTMVIIDGVPYAGDLKDFNASLITEVIVLKGADATAIYGSRGAEGVLIISTKGPIQLPEPKQEPVVKVRKNFNETAFFFPAVHADRDGYYRFTFTMPETVTEWKWKMLAYTKDMQSVYNEKKVLTQLPLMVQPNMPRLLCQGDQIVLKSRISNLDTLAVNGKVTCRIEDAVTGEDLTGKITSNTENSFSLDRNLTGSSAFTLRVPADQVNPLRITIKASSQQFADAEETVIPVVSSRMFVRQTIPFCLYATDTLIRMPALPSDATLYGTGLHIDPQPQAALINALPWLANYSYDCAEQTFNKLMAHVTALKIMRTDSLAQRAFRQAKQQVEKVREPSVQLPDELNEQTTPWLNLARATAQRQKQLFELLDTARTKANIDAYLEKLSQLQNKDDEGMPWFTGGRSNVYISNYLLAGFGKLRQEKWKGDRHTKLIQGLLNYTDAQFLQSHSLYHCYARSFWQKDYALKDSLLQLVKTYISDRWENMHSLSLHDQALLIISSSRYFPEQGAMQQRVKTQLESIRQLAIEDDVMGIRWKEIADTDDPDNTTEETIALLAEAFENTTWYKEIRSGIVKWLLTTRTEDRWSTTKATAAAIGLLQQEKGSVVGETRMLRSNTGLSVSDDLLNGNSFAFQQTTQQAAAPAGEITVTKQGASSAGGAVSWYYFSIAPAAQNLSANPAISRKLYIYNEQTQRREELTPAYPLRIGDKLQVVLTLESSKALRYVYIDDKRAAAFEPVDNSSGYQYGGGFPYYRSVRDAGYQLFAEFIPSGRWEISYELRVAQEGSFTGGPAMLQCMYRPEIHACSNSLQIITRP